jgi:predicted small metal-binding protein
MKKLTCRDLGGPCDEEITGDSFEEVGKKSHGHVMEQINSGNEAHKLAAGKMRDATPEEQKAMMAEYKKKFDEAPEGFLIMMR